MKTIKEIVIEREALQKKIEDEKQRHDALIAEYKNNIEQLNAEENLLSHSIDVRKFNKGKKILDVKFIWKTDSYNTHKICKAPYNSLIQDAKSDLANGAEQLRTRYFGQKHYAGYDQREDHKYGYGPKHGSIYQRIGLSEPYRGDNISLSDNDIECCLYYLNNINLDVENLNKLEELGL